MKVKGKQKFRTEPMFYSNSITSQSQQNMHTCRVKKNIAQQSDYFEALWSSRLVSPMEFPPSPCATPGRGQYMEKEAVTMFSWEQSTAR
jgi:hypothetical protein